VASDLNRERFLFIREIRRLGRPRIAALIGEDKDMLGERKSVPLLPGRKKSVDDDLGEPLAGTRKGASRIRRQDRIDRGAEGLVYAFLDLIRAHRPALRVLADRNEQTAFFPRVSDHRRNFVESAFLEEREPLIR